MQLIAYTIILRTLYDNIFEVNIEDFKVSVSRPGAPHDVVSVEEVKKIKIGLSNQPS